MKDLFDLSGKTALISGSSRGIGEAIARGLGQAGAAVIINSRSTSDAEATAETLRGTGIQARALAFDVTDSAAISAAAAAAGQVDILVNNAGMNKRGSFLDYADEDWERVIATNLGSVFRMSRAFARGMAERRSGKIINIASVTSQIARPSILAYTTSKSGVAGMTRAMAAELAPQGVQANAIAPGFFRTELNAPLIADPEFSAWIERRTPAGRWGDVEELLGAAIFLSSRASSYVSGQTIYVDGGFTAVM